MWHALKTDSVKSDMRLTSGLTWTDPIVLLQVSTGHYYKKFVKVSQPETVEISKWLGGVGHM